ncbi:MAG: LamG-like jellyroll fold domain-containing protein [Elusimicrobiota bacterium]
MRSFLPALLLALLRLAAAAPAAAADDALPALSNFQLTSCNGTYSLSSLTSTGTPSFQIDVQDTGGGLRVGAQPHLAGASALTPTVLMMHFDNSIADDRSAPQSTEKTAGVTYVASQANFSQAGAWPNVNPEYVRALRSATLASATDQLTLQAWVYPQDLTQRPILEFNDGTNVGVLLWHSVGTAGNIYANAISSDGVNHLSSTSYAVMTQNAWNLVTMTLGNSGMNKILRVYVNDVKVGETVIPEMLPLRVDGDLYVGHRPTGGGYTFYGYIDEVRVLTAALGAEGVANDYYAGQFKYSSTSSNGPFTTRYIAGGDYSPAGSNGSVAKHTYTAAAVPLRSGNNYIRFTFQDRSGNTIQQDRVINVQTAPPSQPGGFSGTPTSATGITWNWSASPGLCTGGTYRFYSCLSGVPIASGLGGLSYPEAGYGPNSLNCRRISAVTMYGESSLSAPTSVYTWANPPAAFGASFVSTGSLVVTWGDNGNPGYTRWELSDSLNNFATLRSSPVPTTANYTGLSKAVVSLSPQTTYYLRVRAFNGNASDGNTLGEVFTAFASTTVPTFGIQNGLVGLAQGLTSIRWSWTASPSALDYTLVGTGLGTLTTTAGTLFDQGGLSQNTEYGATLRVRNASGVGPDGAEARIYTLAAAPGPLSITAVTSNTISVSWSGSGNPPAATLYEVFLTTDAGFSGRVSTYSVSATNLTLSGLLPATNYALRARAVNGNGVATAPTAVVTQQTAASIIVSSASTPQTPYAPIAGALGTWHFDEGGGTKAVDASGLANDGQLTCTFVACSTPTYTTGQTGLGKAVRFSGIPNTYCRVPHAANLAGTGSLTVQAWVNPENVNQVADAGLVAKGEGTKESFALVITAGKWRFFLRDAGLGLYQVSSTQSIRVGQWTHLAGVYDAAARTLRIYVDGTLSAVNSVGIPAARYNDAHLVSIGARQPLAAGYDSPFNGLIDEVNLAGRAMTASEVAASWTASRSSELSLPWPNASTHLIIPPDTFGGPADIYASADPSAAPIQASAATVLSALSAPPTGQALIPGTLVELVASVGGLPLTGNFASTVTVSLPYTDDDGNGLIDNTIPPIPAAGLRMYTLDETVVRWTALPTSVDLANRRVLGQTPHFSVFAVFGPSGIRPNTDQVRVYPIPWQPGSAGRFDSASFLGKSGIIFDNLPTEGAIKIFNLAAEFVADVPFSAANVGTVVWDGRNRAGRECASGVYFAYVKSSQGGSSTVLKLVIER